MTLKLDYIPLQGGLDEASGKTVPAAGGRLLGGENFEVVFGVPGYRRINGYERFDGRPEPHAAVYYRLEFDTGTAAISAGNTVDGPDGSGYVLRVQVDSGTWAGGDAAGVLILVAVTGTFADGDDLQVSAVSKAAAAGAALEGASGGADYETDTVLAREYLRGLIAKPAGYGPVRGLVVFGGAVYCLRNDDDTGLTATLWKSSASGWTAAREGLRGGGTLRGSVANFTGTSTGLKLYGCDGKNRYWSYDGTTFTFAPAVYSSECTSTDSITPATGSKTFNFSESSRSWSAGQALIAYSRSDASSYMIGTYASSTGTSVTITVTEAAGATADDWHICRVDGADRPFNIIEHKNYLFLAYPFGQLQYSDLGGPMAYGGTSGVIGLGDNIVDLRTLRADVLGITQDNRINLLYGSGGDTWENKIHSRASGSRSGSLHEVGGDGVFLNDAGLMTLAGSQAFGDFDAASIGMAAQVSLSRILRQRTYTAAALSKADSQYRIYTSSGEVLVMTWFGAVARENAVFMRLRYDHSPVCATSATIDDEEYVLFGTADGWVMRDRVGTTFDGEDITAFLRTVYWHFRTSQQRKRFRKVTLDCDSEGSATFYFKLDYDFAGPDQASTINFELSPAGGYFDIDYWNEFFWSSADTAQLEASIEGVGHHVSMMLWVTGDYEPFSINGAGWQFSPIRVVR